MRLNVNLTEIFNSPAKISVLQYVIKPGFMMTGREISRICGISHSMTIHILKEFEDFNLVSSRRAGKSVVWTPKQESFAYSIVNKFFSESNLFSPIEHLKVILRKWVASKHKYIEKMIIFGSVAEKNEKSSSDIDIFVQVKSQENKKKIEKSLEDLSIACIKLYGNSLSPYILSKNELQAKHNSLLIKNIEKGIKIL